MRLQRGMRWVKWVRCGEGDEVCEGMRGDGVGEVCEVGEGDEGGCVSGMRWVRLMRWVIFNEVGEGDEVDV